MNGVTIANDFLLMKIKVAVTIIEGIFAVTGHLVCVVARFRLRSRLVLYFSDRLYFVFNSHAIKVGNWNGSKEFDSILQHVSYFIKGSHFFFIATFNCRRILNAPMCGHRLARPDRTNLTSCIIADGKNKI